MSALFLMVAAAAAPALEPVPTWGLRWSAPAECSQAATISRLVEDRAKREVFAATSTYLIDAVLEKADGGWRARVALIDERGTVLGSRDVSSPEASCKALDANLAIVISLLITTPVRPAALPPPPAPVEPRRLPAPPAQVRVEREVAPRAPWIAVATGAVLTAAGAVGLGYSFTVFGRLQQQRAGLADPVITVSRDELGRLQWLYPASWGVLAAGLVAVTAGVLWYLLAPRELKEPL